MEKKLPHYSLTTIKATFATPDKLRMTQSANNAALSLGFDRASVVTVIQTINRSHFYKSMTRLQITRFGRTCIECPLVASFST